MRSPISPLLKVQESTFKGFLTPFPNPTRSQTPLGRLSILSPRMSPLPIHISKDRVAAFCRRHHIRKLSLFGSVLGENFRSDSDVDVLVEFDPAHIPGFIHLHQLEQELAPLLGNRRLGAPRSTIAASDL